MAKHSDPLLDSLFTALSDPTRRAIIARLAEGPAAVKELAAPHPMALSSFLKHIAVLERAHLVSTSKKGRVRTCRLNPDAFRPAETWLASRRRQTTVKIDRLASLLEGMRGGAPDGR
ncbi:MAG: metalloregulator ArsR/SmtB family transcription factor [Pseudomonadota bacterium]